MRFQAILRILGAITALTSLFALPPLLLAVALDEQEAIEAFVDSFLAAAVPGFLLWWPLRKVKYELRLRDGFFITTGIWVLVSLVSAIPFVLAPPNMNYTDAVFEAVSGFTTTGATTIVGIDALPRSVLLYRQSLNFYGGMGIIVLAVAILPMLKVGGMQLFRAESTGPGKDSKLTPRIAETAKALWLIYFGLNVLCALAFWIGGMSLFDAVCHALSTIATAGFSTHDAGFGFWDSTLLDAIATVFMFVGGVNFALHYVAWRRASFDSYLGDSELRAYAVIIGVVTLAVTLVLWATRSFDGPGESLRHAAFQTVSNVTTTGFMTTGFVTWPSFAPLLLILIGFIGGCSGSTTGGLKVARVLMSVRQGLREVKQLVHPRGQFLVKMGGRRVSESIVLSVGGFVTLYLLSFIVVMLMLAGIGIDPVTAFSAAATCINNLGPGLGAVAIHFGDMSDAGVWICSFAMILGRLEVFAVLVLFTPGFWKE
ncbi:MAG: TrkH family potassium uptake protein [Chiayiivirga sp.]|jgi:trk system potassium uptake protein TrkH|uniref:TrkH family potassium uptake protein n=1 Tax=Chiayiivirga sp. TaxID=2041042 RepID=UPI0025C4E8AC|nr:TrkH family potassium uptake protein [Chiayiivirga sp.]MCI1711119.1 TrkH family potassium uptake protein [Chiayiivirga sp.]MCI1728085.1 TrkH family potassium uptake protein [Chiayiivirga sp.]